MAKAADRPAGPSSRSNRLTPGFITSVTAGLVVIVLTLGLTGFAVDRNLRAVEGLMDQVITVEEPTKAAAHELEINVLGTGLAVWKYLATGDAEHRERVTKDEADFRRFRAQYGRLARSAAEQELGEEIDALYDRYLGLGHRLMDGRDAYILEFDAVAETIDRIDRVLDEQIQPGIRLDAPDGAARLYAAAAIEADVAEIGSGIGAYLANPSPLHRDRIRESVKQAHKELVAFGELQLAPDERLHAAEIERLLDAGVPRIERAAGLHDVLLLGQADFITARNDLDDLLDEGIQALAGHGLTTVQPRARESIDDLDRAILVMLALGAVICIGAASLITYRSVQLHAANQGLRREIALRAEAEAERVRLLSELVDAQEKERGRLARELHDQMGQQLSTIMLGLKCLGRPADHAPGQLQLPELEELTGQLIQEVNTIAWELRPAALDDLGLHGALSNYVEEWARRSAVSVDFESDMKGQRLPGSVEVALYRVAQEALTNVMKHAQARTVSLTLQRHGQEVVMVIEDDGRGFVAEQVVPPAGTKGRLGLLGMKERAAMAGGTLELESTPGGGTTLVVRVSAS